LNSQTIIEQTRCWLKSTIIDLNFCPFANQEFINNTIYYSVSDSGKLETSLQSLANEFQYLDSHPETETTLLIFSAFANNFDDFLELIDYANQLLDDLDYTSIYQLAHFHPDYHFDGVEETDASNYTNRSPWPTLHIIREKSLQLAIEKYPDTASIPDTNIKLARKLGSAKLQALLNNCLKSR